MTKKFNPGHYVALLRKYDSPDLIRKLASTPNLRGFMKRYTHASLEPEQGKYTLDEIENDLALCQSLNMMLVAQIEDKTFGIPSQTAPENPMPAYLQAKTAINKANGITAIRWEPQVLRRSVALLRELGCRFDSHPNFEGVVTGESAPSLDSAVLTRWNYTPELYRDAFKTLIEYAGISFPTTGYFWMQNFLPRGQQYIGEILQWATQTGQTHLCFGGPDCLQKNDALVTNAYPNYTKYNGMLPSFILMSSPSYDEWSDELQRVYTVAEQRDYAIKKLGVEYIFWMYRADKWGEVTATIA